MFFKNSVTIQIYVYVLQSFSVVYRGELIAAACQLTYTKILNIIFKLLSDTIINSSSVNIVKCEVKTHTI